jgi:hypothetical protein
MELFLVILPVLWIKIFCGESEVGSFNLTKNNFLIKNSGFDGNYLDMVSQNK